MEKQRIHASGEFSLSLLKLHAMGRWRNRQRQVVDIWYGEERLGELALGPARWATLAVLIRAAMDSVVTRAEDKYLNKGEIARILREVDSPFAFASHVKTYLYDLRNDLDRFLQPHLGFAPGGGAWGELLIGTHTLGYYVAVPPENLRLTILDRMGPDLRSPPVTRV